MNKPYKLSLHIFRRDLRLQDNTALMQALQQSHAVIPCFIFDKRQLETNDYCGDATLQFMATSLNELDADLQKKGGQLYCFNGIAEEVIDKLLTTLPIDAVFVNRDYTPFSRSRDEKISAVCQRHGIALHSFADALLHEPEECLKANKEPYTVFTHFYNRASELSVSEPIKNNFNNYYQEKISGSDNQTLAELSKLNNPDLTVKGGRAEGIQLLKKMPSFKDYDNQRNLPAESATTHLSAHHKFGTISIRESHAMICKVFNRYHTLIRELYWRDFFTHIAWHFPRVFSGAFHVKYNQIPWQHDSKHFAIWCQGMTGFPIVDAGMRELNTTGFMHNRVRMVVASFLTKDLLIDWRLGEKYFAQQLVDYDPSVNNGNWQWSASTGCDAQPYFRIFNPWLQQQKFDPECVYIKRWVPELSSLTPKEIHNLATKRPASISNYPPPMLDHAEASTKAKSLYKNI